MWSNNMTLKYKPRFKMWANSNKTNEVDEKGKWARSYGWWYYFVEVEGYGILNMSRYSATTSRHQHDGKLELFSINPCIVDVVLRHTTANLTMPVHALDDEIINVRREIRDLEELIAKPRTRKTANQKRQYRIEELKLHIINVERVRLGITERMGYESTSVSTNG